MRYLVCIRAGVNAEGVPEQYVVETIPIRKRAGMDRDAFEHDSPPEMPAEYASNPLALVMSEPQYRAHNGALQPAYDASQRSRMGAVYKRLTFRFKQSLAQWKRSQRAAGIEYGGKRVPIDADAMATISALSNVRTAIAPADFPIVLFDGAVSCANANAIRDLEVAMATRVADIETAASDWSTRANAAGDVSVIDAIELEMG